MTINNIADIPAKSFGKLNKGHFMICDLIKEAVAFSHKALTKEEALYQVIELICSAYNIDSHDDIIASIMERENKLSTGIGLEIAVPHCRIDMIESRMSAVLFVPSGIEYNSVDRLPVKLIFLIVSPTIDVQGHIACLSSIARAVSDENTRCKLIGAESQEELFMILSTIEV